MLEWRITNSSLFVIRYSTCNYFSAWIWFPGMTNNKQLVIRYLLFVIRMTNNKQLVIRYSTCNYFSAWMTNNKQLVTLHYITLSSFQTPLTPKVTKGGLGSSSGPTRPGKKKKKAALSSRLLFTLCILIIINITGPGGPPGIFPVSRRPSPPLKVTSGASTITCYTKYSSPAQHAG